VLNLRGLIFSHLKKYEEALDDYRKILKINASYHHAISNTALIFSTLNQFEKAEKLIKRAIQLKPDDIRYQSNLGFIYLEAKQFQEAEQIFDELLAKGDKREPVILNNRGFARLKLGETDSALKDFEESIESYPENSYAFKNLGLLYIEINQLDKACEYFDQAIKFKFTETYGDEVKQLQSEYCEN